MSRLTMQSMVLGVLPGMQTAVVNQYLQDSYEELCSRWPWLAMTETYRLHTLPDINSGTYGGVVEATHDASPTTIEIVADADGGGPGEGSVGELAALVAAETSDATRYLLRIAGNTETYEIASIANSVITLDASSGGYSGTTLTTADKAGWELIATTYPLYSGSRELLSIRHEQPLEEIDQVRLDRMDPKRNQTGNPTRYSARGKTSTLEPLVELWPRPTSSETLTYRVRINPSTLGDADIARISERLVALQAIMNLMTVYNKVFPDLAKQVAYDWKSLKTEFSELWSDMILEDSRNHSPSEVVMPAGGGGLNDNYSLDDFNISTLEDYHVNN